MVEDEEKIMLKNELELINKIYYEKMNKFRVIIKDLKYKLEESINICDEKQKDIK